MVRHILVPVDGTSQSYAALPFTRTLARATGAAVTLLRMRLPGESLEQVQLGLERVRAELAQSELEVVARVRDGDAADGILAELQAKPASLVVMRTRGRSGVGRAVLGSVTQQVVARSLTPVVLVRAGGRRVSQLRTILVPLDGSPGGLVALSSAIPLADASHAAVRLLQVVVPVPAYLYSGPAWNGGEFLDPLWDDEALTAARGFVARLAARITHLEVTNEVVVAASVPDAIVHTATERNVDLIVMSTHALTGAARALLGSVTDAVVRSADCPVLVVHRAVNHDSATPLTRRQ
jgi:nucleotide-binding universal stress UspA family protein